MSDGSKHPERLGTWANTTAHGETVRAFIPPKLPPVPAIDMVSLTELTERANIALGRLDGVTSILPATQLFIFMYVRKEAVLSSQIEGTQSSLNDLLLFEADEPLAVPLDDVEEVSNYIAALTAGIERMKTLPLSLRLIREIHGILLRGGRGASLQPGEFRRSQNWIGGTRPGNAEYVPPPVPKMAERLNNFESFLHANDDLPVLIKAAIAHVQFESIHPFLDGNGRLGRLLITLLLYASGTLQEPTLYLSLYLKKHRQTYYDLLQQVRLKGDWEAWIAFFLEGVAETAEQAARTARSILELFDIDTARIQTLGRGAGSAAIVHQYLQKRALLSVPQAAKNLNLSEPTIHKACKALAGIGITLEITGRQRRKVYAYDKYLALLKEGTEPL